ncbi:cytochrome P450 monooxygenase [Apiospora sp. TS-2023a]
MNPYVINRNKEIFGPDADEFNPERWLQQEGETHAEYQERMRLWNASDLTFGGGSRICLGRHLSQMELYKAVATLITRYEIELVDAKEEWNAVARWLYRVSGGLTCRLRKRDSRG